ncbi:MAG: DinB family protein [bacterium]
MRSPLDLSSRMSVSAAMLVVAFAAIASASDAGAQASVATEDAVALRATFVTDLDSLQAKFLALAEAIPADKYAWRPAAGVRSIGEVFMHVASEYYFYTPLAYGATPSPVVGRGKAAFAKFESASTKSDVLKHLEEGFAYAKQSLGAVEPANLVGSRKLFGGDFTIAQTSFLMADDLHEHLGQLIAYSRSVGVKPPWTR